MPTSSRSYGGAKNNRDDIFQVIVGLKVMKGEKENRIKGHVVSGYKNTWSADIRTFGLLIYKHVIS